jgi:hypothetical protein
MSFIGNAVGNILGTITGSRQAGQAASDASAIQAQSAQQGIDEQRRQFDALVELMSPFVQAGTGALKGLDPYMQAGVPALQQQQALAGTLGNEQQQAAIDQVAQSPEMLSLIQQGENALLQGASATGGLRGGNVQAALAQFRPQLLSELINQQYARLGGLSDVGRVTTSNLVQLGQSAAAGQGAAGLNSATSIGNLLAQQGAATAGGRVAQGSTASRTFGTLSGLLGGFVGAGGTSGIKKAFS